MRPIRARLTIGRMMLIIALGTSLVVGVVETARLLEIRSDRLGWAASERAAAESPSGSARVYRETADSLRRQRAEGKPLPTLPLIFGPTWTWDATIARALELAEDLERQAGLHEGRARKFERAARTPWRAVESD